jgi:hypothetical protein
MRSFDTVSGMQADAEAFHAQLAPAAEKAIFKKET